MEGAAHAAAAGLAEAYLTTPYESDRLMFEYVGVKAREHRMQDLADVLGQVF